MSESSPRRPASEHLDTLIERIGVVPLEEMLRDLLKRSSAALGVERASYWSLVAEGTAIRRELQFHFFSGAFDNGPLTLDAKNFPAYFQALRRGSSLIVADDAMEDTRLAEFRETFFRPLGIGAMLDAPVYRHGRLFGVVCHEHVGGPREWTAGEIDFARYVAQWVALAVEIDQCQRTETALRESEARYRLVIEHSPTPMVVVDMRSGRFADANESAARFFGVDRESLLEGGPADFSPQFQPDGRASAESARERFALALEGETPCFDWVHRRADGTEVPCSIHLARVPGKGIEQVLAAVTDRPEETIRYSTS